MGLESDDLTLDSTTMVLGDMGTYEVAFQLLKLLDFLTGENLMEMGFNLKMFLLGGR